MRKSGALRIGIVLLLASVVAGVFALVGRADDPAFGVIDSSIGPGIVDANANVLVKASWQYLDNRNPDPLLGPLYDPGRLDAAWTGTRMSARSPARRP